MALVWDAHIRYNLQRTNEVSQPWESFPPAILADIGSLRRRLRWQTCILTADTACDRDANL
jgi:hypothetical protein